MPSMCRENMLTGLCNSNNVIITVLLDSIKSVDIRGNRSYSKANDSIIG